MLKHHAKNIETSVQNIMLKATEVVIYSMLQSGNVHTHSNSKLYGHAQSSGQQLDNTQFPTNCVVYLATSVRYPVKFDLKFAVLAYVLTSVIA